MSEPMVLTMARRGVRLTTRNPDAMITSLVLPVVIMLVFVYLFGGAIEGTTASYVNYVMPGVLLQCTAIVSGLTAIGVSNDLHEGIVERFRSMDVSPAALSSGHIAASLVRNATAMIGVTTVALLIGFRPTATALEWIGALATLLMFAFALSWFAAAFGLLARTPEGASGIQFVVIFLPYVSSGFVPLDTLPSWLHGFAEHQPVTPVIETVRGLLMDVPIEQNAWLAVVWCVGIAIVSVMLAGVLFRARTR